MIHFVGAGSGAPDLITAEGKEISGGGRCHYLCRFPGESAASGVRKGGL